MWKRIVALVGMAVLAAVTLSGCATGYLLDNNVQSFSSLPSLPPQPTYRFERLPSQQAAPGQTQLEALADPALFKAGLRRDDAMPQYSVQVSAAGPARRRQYRAAWSRSCAWGPAG